MKALKHLNKYFFKYRWRFILGVIFVAISNVFAIYPAQIIRKAFDYVIDNVEKIKAAEGESQLVLQNEMIEAVVWFATLVVILALLKGFFLYLMRQTIIVMSRFIEFDLKNEVFAQYQKLDTAFYKQNNTGDLMNRISEDVSRVRMYLGPAIMYTINLIVLFVLVVATMLTINVKLTIFVLLPLPVLSISIYYVSTIINKRSEKVQRKLSYLSTIVQETFSGIRVIKAYNKSENKEELFAEECVAYKDKNLDLVKVEAVFMPLMMLLIGLSTIITVFVGGTLAIAGEITTGNIAEFVIYVNMLTWPVAALGWVTSLVQRASASQERINEFLKITSDIDTSVKTKFEFSNEIEFKDVSYTYADSGIKAIQNLNLKFKAGSTVAIMGKTGSGKSTVANLLLRLYDVSNGSVLLDGTNIKSLGIDSLRQQIGFVPQEVFLFSETIKNNVAFGFNNKIDDEVLHNALKDADVYDNIMQFTDQLETMVGERGITLSGGQKQRLSIARALVRNPKILIFDDSLSAVDTETEERIIQNLKSSTSDKTTIFITHRISASRHADYVYFIDNGTVVEQGTHNELVDKKGRYYNLFKKQLSEFQPTE